MSFGRTAMLLNCSSNILHKLGPQYILFFPWGCHQVRLTEVFWNSVLFWNSMVTLGKCGREGDLIPFSPHATAPVQTVSLNA